MVGVWSITNTASLKVLEVSHGIEDALLIQLNNEEPEWVPLEYKEENDFEPSIEWGGSDWLLSECMRTNF
jgi:hypothetical protein